VQAKPFENLRSTGVVVRKPFVLLAVELDRGLRGVTLEIHRETVERDLPSELCAVKARATQGFPKRLLRPGLMLAQSAGEFTPL
jgi:hypothetical protein